MKNMKANYVSNKYLIEIINYEISPIKTQQYLSQNIKLTGWALNKTKKV